MDGRDDPAASHAWSADGYARDAPFVSALGAPLIDVLDPRAGERVLDLGCGDGELAAVIAGRGASASGIDASSSMIDAARARGIDARVGDGQRLGDHFESRTFDAVFSNAALHWMPDAGAVLDGVRHVSKPGARFVGEAGGHGNVAAVATALLAALAERDIDGAARWPWRFPTADEWRADLERHGFEVDDCRLVPRPTPLPTGIDGWLVTFADPFLAGLDDAGREAVRDRVAELLAPSLRDGSGRWTADYVRLRFVARLARRAGRIRPCGEPPAGPGSYAPSITSGNVVASIGTHSQ